MALVKNNFGVLTSIHDDGKHSAVHAESTTGNEVAQAEVVLLCALGGTVSDHKGTVEVIQVGVR